MGHPDVGHTSNNNTQSTGLCVVDSRGRLSPYLPRGLKPGSVFLWLYRTTGSHALPGLARGAACGPRRTFAQAISCE